jgi:PBSX family phage terminase large subunit
MYGSAKTSTCAAEMIRLTLSTPNGTSLIGAATQPQLEQTAKKDFMSMLHPAFVENYSMQKNYIDLTNGHRVLFRPLDQEAKARSLNLCYIWIEEASEVNFDYVVQLQTRMRNHATEHHKMILSTNPDLGWVRTEFLMKANNITGAERVYFINEEDKNPNISVHVAATKKNKFLPPDYLHSVSRGKPRWWIERYLNASFDFAEGSVYSDFMDHIVDPFQIPPHFERIGGADFGVRDANVMLMGAIDPTDGTVYIYEEYYKSGLTVPQHAQKMLEMLEQVPFGRLRFLVGDPAGKRRNINDHKSIFDHYGEYGIFFKEGNNRIEAGIAKVQAYFSTEKLKIFKTCVNTIREGMNYKYKPLEMDSNKNMDEKPIDKDNHAMDSLRYMINELPDDPRLLINTGKKPHVYGTGKQTDDTTLPFALQDPEDSYVSSSRASWLNY